MNINHLLGKYLRRKVRARTCDNDASAILQAVRVLKAQGLLPNLDKAGNATLQGLVSKAGIRRRPGMYPTCVPYGRVAASFAIDVTSGNTFHDVFQVPAGASRAQPIFANGSTSATYTIASVKAVVPSDYAGDPNANTGSWATGTLPSSGVVPVAPGANRRGFLFGDWIDLTNTLGSPYIGIRSHIAAGAGSITIMGASGVDLTPWASRSTRAHLHRNQVGNHVATVSTFTSTTNASVSPCIGVRYETAAGVVVVMKGGDSIDSGEGTYKGESFWDLALEAICTEMGVGFDVINMAWPSADYNQFPYAFEEAIAAGLTAPIACFPIGTPNGVSTAITANNISTMRARCGRMLSAAHSAGMATLMRSWLPSNGPLVSPSGGSENYGTDDSRRRDYNAESVAAPGANIVNLTPTFSGGIDAGGQEYILNGLTADGVHPNDAGNAVGSVAVQTPMRATILSAA